MFATSLAALFLRKLALAIEFKLKAVSNDLSLHFLGTSEHCFRPHSVVVIRTLHGGSDFLEEILFVVKKRILGPKEKLMDPVLR